MDELVCEFVQTQEILLIQLLISIYIQTKMMTLEPFQEPLGRDIVPATVPHIDVVPERSPSLGLSKSPLLPFVNARHPPSFSGIPPVRRARAL